MLNHTSANQFNPASILFLYATCYQVSLAEKQQVPSSMAQVAMLTVVTAIALDSKRENTRSPSTLLALHSTD
jgi:hypothetical protein